MTTKEFIDARIKGHQLSELVPLYVEEYNKPATTDAEVERRDAVLGAIESSITGLILADCGYQAKVVDGKVILY